MPIPFTVIGGFLGSGKTTLVNSVIRQSKGTRFALLVNDFGDVNIDVNLISKHNGRTLELSNGCICCSLANGFVQTMLEVMKRADEIDHIVVEASGVSDPQKIMDFARLDSQLFPDAVITLVDAVNCLEHLSDPLIADTVKTQIRGANILLLNKVDLNPETEDVIAALKRSNADAMIIRSAGANFPVEALMGIHAPYTDATRRYDAGGNNTPENTPMTHPFQSMTWRLKKKVDKQLFSETLADVSRTIIRGKGFLSARKARYIWHLCGKEQTFSPQSSSQRNTTEIVFIGLDPVDLANLNKRLRETF